MSVQDIDRPDVDGNGPKMATVCEQVKEALAGLVPSLRISTDDNFSSSVYIRGSYDKKEDWPGNIWENSRYFAIDITPKTRYYAEGDKLTVEIHHKSYKLPKMRRYTGPVDKVIAKITAWIEGSR